MEGWLCPRHRVPYAVQNTDTLHCEQIVSSVRMIIDTTEESGCRILANVLDQEMTTSRMFVEEIRDIVDETGNNNKRSLLSLLLVAFPADDGKVVAV